MLTMVEQQNKTKTMQTNTKLTLLLHADKLKLRYTSVIRYIPEYLMCLRASLSRSLITFSSKEWS